ncbi:hypothetical protein HMPREF3193_00540 [Bifidobacterium breve]|nr:hypothetical protein HMPREF3193_00540 [Bifidobacterium breve]
MADFQRFWEDWICRMNTIRPFFVLCGMCVCHMGAETPVLMLCGTCLCS